MKGTAEEISRAFSPVLHRFLHRYDPQGQHFRVWLSTGFGGVMGARGPAPMPDNVRALNGNPGNKPDPVRVKAKPGAPNPPGWLNAEARAEWRRVVPELDRLGVLAKIDRAVLAAYCSAWSRSVETQRNLDEDGVTYVDAHGDERKNPNWQIWRESVTTFAALAKELFVSPAARLRTVLPEAPDGSEDESGILD